MIVFISPPFTRSYVGESSSARNRLTGAPMCWRIEEIALEIIEKSIGKRNQLWAFMVLGFFVLVSLWTYALDERYIYLSAYLWFGLIYGMSLQYGRFCMASACRDLFAVGVPRMAVGIMIALVLFSLVSALVTGAGKSSFGASPAGLHVVIGGLIFGVGMVFAGVNHLR